jgi:ribosomal protein L29
MVEKKVHEKIRARSEDEVKGDIVKLKEELKDLRNNKAANANSTKTARIKV